MPNNFICQMLLEQFGHPIISTSATLPGHEYMNDPDEIARVFEHSVDLFIDTDYGGIEPSTIIDFTGDEAKILRKGKGFKDDLY